MDLNCSYQFSNPGETTLTVGELFGAHCTMVNNTMGDGPIDFNKVKVKFEEGKNYDLVIVKTIATPNEVDFIFTSYIVGPKKMPAVVLTDGQREIKIQPELNFEVKSVLKADKKPEMFGPMSGIAVPIPMFYWLVLGALLLLSISSFGTVAARRWKRRKMLARIKALDDGTQPVQQFFTTYRKLQRENAIFNARSDADNKLLDSEAVTQTTDELLKIVSMVEAAFKLFFTRTFRIASSEMSWPASIRELARHHELVYSIFGAELIELSREYQKIGVGKGKLEAKDAILISEKSRKWIEKADQLQRAIVAKDNQQIKRLRGGK